MENDYGDETYEMRSIAEESYDSDSSSGTSEKQTNTKSFKKNNYRTSDPGYHKLSFRNNKKKKVKQEFYSTSIIPGTKIRNAISGYYEEHSVGSLYEELYFKVIDSTCRFEKTTTPVHLFYDSPEQYERHNNSILSDETKRIWHDRYTNTVKHVKD